MPVGWVSDRLRGIDNVKTISFGRNDKLSVTYTCADRPECHIVCYAPNSGEYLVTAELVDRLAKEGVNVVVCAIYCQFSEESYEYGDGIGLRVMRDGAFFAAIRRGARLP